MLNLIIAPKKVFRNIYYHVRPCHSPSQSSMTLANPLHRNVRAVRHRSDSSFLSADKTDRDEEFLPPCRPSLHLPPLALLPTHGSGLGVSLRRWVWESSQGLAGVRTDPSAGNQHTSQHADVFPRRARAWQATPRAIRPTERR